MCRGGADRFEKVVPMGWRDSGVHDLKRYKMLRYSQKAGIVLLQFL